MPKYNHNLYFSNWKSPIFSGFSCQIFIYLALFLSVVAFAKPSLAQEQIQIDFGGSDTPAVGWNLLQRTETGLSNLQNSAGDVTDVGIRVDRMYWLQNNSGGDATSLDYPNAASKDSFVGRDNGFPSWQFSLTGLLPSQPYTLNFFASRMGFNDGREAQYEVLGETSETVTLNASNNDSKEVIANVVSNSAGEITVIVSAGPNNTNGAGYYYLGALKITPPQSLAPTVSFITPTSGTEFTEGSPVSVDVAASDSDGRISNVDLYVNGTFVRTERFIPYTWNDSSRNQVDLALQELPLGTHVLKAVAVDDAGVTSEQSINIIVKNDVVNAVMTPSRTECASPCTVTFSAEDTTVEGFTEDDVWLRVAYHWDFDTDETDTYGSLYQQTYTNVEGDTAFEKGHVPMVTKTFLCDTGTCTYNVGMRAQNADGDFDDVYQTISVKAESTAWSAENTICVSNTLSTASDWSAFDKACPEGATKQSLLPAPHAYDNKLVLLHRGDVFDQSDLFPSIKNVNMLPIFIGQSNFKITNFGDEELPPPHINGAVRIDIARGTHSGDTLDTVTRIRTSDYLVDADVDTKGWSENIYFEDIKLNKFFFASSFKHVGLHKLDMDAEASELPGGHIVFNTGARCVGGHGLSCDNVPFAKGAYISQVDVVGSKYAERKPKKEDADQGFVGLNISGIGCPMVNYTGIVDSRFRKAYEHNIRIMGWYRMNIMRSIMRGEHYQPGGRKNHKLTTRNCIYRPSDNADPLIRGAWQADTGVPSTLFDDIEGRTRVDIDAGQKGYIHQSRYMVIAHNKIGDTTAPIAILADGSEQYGENQYRTNILDGDQPLQRNTILYQNQFEKEPGNLSAAHASLQGEHSVCIDNSYDTAVNGCSIFGAGEGTSSETAPITLPLAPGSN